MPRLTALGFFSLGFYNDIVPDGTQNNAFAWEQKAGVAV